MFVFGVVTTSEWMVLAIKGPTMKSKGASVYAGDITTVTNGRVSVTLSGRTLPSRYYRYGPTHRQESTVIAASDRTQDPLPQESNQCLFIHYYKMKRRFLWLLREPMQAAAGPHQLPPGDNAGGGAPMVPVPYEFEPESEQHEVSPSLSRLSS